MKKILVISALLVLSALIVLPGCAKKTSDSPAAPAADTGTATETATITETPTISETPTTTNTPTESSTLTETYTKTSTFTITNTPTQTETVTQTSTVTETPTQYSVAFRNGSYPNAGYNGVTDTFISSANGTYNYGLCTELNMNSDGASAERILVRFDLSSIPQSATVIDVGFYLTLSQSTLGGDFYLYKVTKAWGEGSICGMSSAGGASWGAAEYGTSNWATEGGDFDASYLLYNGLGVNAAGAQWGGSNADVIAAVQGWVTNPATNYGFLLKIVNEALTKSIYFGSSEHTDSDYRPYMYVIYSN